MAVAVLAALGIPAFGIAASTNAPVAAATGASTARQPDDPSGWADRAAGGTMAAAAGPATILTAEEATSPASGAVTTATEPGTASAAAPDDAAVVPTPEAVSRLDVAGLAATLATLTPEQWAALPPELREELQAILGPAWVWGATVRLAAEWRDNVLLSPVSSTARALGRAQLESYLWRRPAGAWEWLGFLNGDVARLMERLPELAGEQEWFGHLEGRWTPRPGWKAVLTAQAYFQDQVLDLSATETERFVARMRVTGGRAGADLTVPLRGAWALVAGGRAHRSDYVEFAEDFTEGEGSAALRWRVQRGEERSLETTLGWTERRRTHPDRNQYTAGGRPLPGTRLRFRIEEARLETKVVRGAWSGGVVLTTLLNRDLGSGYFDYAERGVRLTLERATPRWRVTAEAGGARSRYNVQTVGIGFDPPLRRRDYRELRLRVERVLNPRWTLFADAAAERSRENEAGGTYRARMLALGVARVWEPSSP